MANCYYSENKKTEALFHYDFITTKPNNNYYIEGLKYAGEITYDAKDFKKSLAYFSILEDVSIDQEDLSISKKGQFYCFHYLENPNSTIKYAKKVLQLSDINPKLQEDAYLFLGQSYQKIDQLDSSKLYYDSVVQYTKSIAAAEAKYHICEIAYQTEDFLTCESLIMELVKQKPSYDYWLAKGILLLGDNFTAQKDYFNAKHSVESILDNYDGYKKEEILAAAVQKIEFIQNLELNELQQEPEQEELEIELESIDKGLEKTKEELNPKEVDAKEIKQDENK